MKKLLIFCLVSVTSSFFAQEYVHQVIVVNEGYYDYQTSTIIEPVTIGTFDPSTNLYSTMDTLYGMRFASDALLDEGYLYIAADSKIYKYDMNSFDLITSVEYSGVRNLGIWGNNLIASRGEYLTSYDSYLNIFDKSNLTLTQSFDTLTGPKWSTQNIVIENNIAYVLVNNAYEWGNEKGIIGQLNLESMNYGDEIDLGPNGKNPDNLMIKNGSLITVNNKDWSGASVSKVDILNNSVETINLANAITGCGTSAIRDDKLIYQISMENTLNEYDIDLMSNVGPVNNHILNYYELKQNPVNGNLFAAETDFVSFGQIHVFNQLNEELFSFNTDVTPGVLVFDVREQSNSIIENSNQRLNISPNPASTEITIGFESNSYSISNTNGDILKVSDSKNIDIQEFAAGTYFISDDSGRKARFVKY